ncbi:MAG: peptidase C39 family protein [Candidatus Marsarchaeota archaeon]|jgi:hypothetical protein|nr:peptidase C39 family protein [Candidatus Marsarchaeota archaeon]
MAKKSGNTIRNGRREMRRTTRAERNAARVLSSRPAVPASKKPGRAKNKIAQKFRKARIREKVMFEIPHYPQTEDFTSSAACAMMVLRYLNKNFQFKKEQEYDIWQEAVNGSVWHGSKYGLAYALAKRGAEVCIVSNTKDEGYDKKLAVYENINLDTLTASYNEIKGKAEAQNVDEDHSIVTINGIKKALSSGNIPIVLIDANTINPYMESSPHWVVVKGYDKDAFYINDPYSDNTITLDPGIFRSSLGFDANLHMILINSRHYGNR